MSTKSTTLTTHTGSLPRPHELLDALEHGAPRPDTSAGFNALLRPAVEGIVRQQADCGLDIVGDGEMSKPSFVAYVYNRLSGFDTKPAREPSPWWTGSREAAAFPSYYASLEKSSETRAITIPQMMCTGPIEYVGHAELERDLQNLHAAMAQAGRDVGFVTATSPSNIEDTQPNEYYSSQEEYLFAIAAALREEYRAIVDAGFILQVDDPRIATRYTLQPEASIEDCREWAMVRVEALNEALRGIPPERVRFHTCYSIDMGPRAHEMELKDIVDIVVRVSAGGYLFEAANPRHEHEWQVWEDVKLGDDKVLIPGVVTHSTVLVEHPDLVAQRIRRFVDIVGRERVIAGVDCGFAAIAAAEQVHPDIVWAKLAALVEGARRASCTT